MDRQNWESARALNFKLEHSLTSRIDGHTLNAGVRLRLVLVTDVRPEIPDVDAAALIADDQVLLVGVEVDRGHGGSGRVDPLALKVAHAQVPNLDRAVLATRVHPSTLFLWR